ncbi:hypothetical protein [Marilutibacter maris]|uniref:hypothetical protein n=1 Tax=Marilutibacter maris TaxID=1605891 RepID=UPI0011AE2152|nr:hypothetical protein [Lysobacter maris]
MIRSFDAHSSECKFHLFILMFYTSYRWTQPLPDAFRDGGDGPLPFLWHWPASGIAVFVFVAGRPLAAAGSSISERGVHYFLKRDHLASDPLLISVLNVIKM